MKDITITVSKETRMVDLSKKFLGNDGENLQANIIFKFSDEFVNGQGRLEYETENEEKNYIVLDKADETYFLPIKNVLTKQGTVNMQLVITEGINENEIPVFKSKPFYLWVNESINAVTEAPEGYELWIEKANEKLNEMDNLNIDIIPEDNNLKIILTKKDGTTKEIILEGAKSYDDTEVKRLIKVNADAILKLDKEKVSISDLKDYVVDKDYVHTDNNFTNEERNKLSNLENYDDTELRNRITTAEDDIDNLETTVARHTNEIANKQPKGNYIEDENYVHTDNNYTSEDKKKLSELNNYDDTEIKQEIKDIKDNKQNKLTAGDNITIDENNVISATGGGTSNVDDVRINDVSIVEDKIANIDLTDYVKNTDYATSSKSGVIKQGNGLAVSISTGVTYGSVRNLQQYKNDGTGLFISKGTFENLKTNNLSSESSDVEIPTAKTVYDNLNNKQNKLTAGDNITIDENNVISAIGGSSEYDDTEIKNEISKLSINKANAIVIESQLTNNSDLEFAYESDDYKNTTFIKIKSTELNYDKILLSKNVELLPDFDSISNDGSTGGLTIELIDNNSLRINGNCTSNMAVFLKLQNNNSFKINKSLTKDSNVCFGLLSKGTMTGSENYLTTVFEGSTNTSKNIYFSGNGIKQEVLPLKSDSNSMKIWLNLIAGNNYDNYIVTPFAFEGKQIEIIDNPSYVNEYYNIKLSDLSEYNYISTYPNKHKIKYNEDTKKYIDNIKPEPSPDPVKPDLTYITPEDYGAKGDGATDDTKALNDCLLAAKSSGGRLYVRGLKEYRITSTIEIIGDFLDVELNRITYEGNDFAVKIVSRWANIHLKTIFANNGSGILLKDDNASTSCVSNNFYFDFINSKNDCIKFEALYEWNIAYNNFKVPHLKSVDSNLINVNNSCSECSFIGARVDCINGWCIFKSVNTNVFRDFSFEKCKNICYGYAKLENCRTTEGLNYYPWKGSEGTLIKLNKVGECIGSIISDYNTQSTYTGIDISEVPSFDECITRINEKIEEYAEDEQRYYKAFYDVIEYSPNIISNVTRYDAGQNSIEYRLNGKVVIYWNKKAYVPNNEITVDILDSSFIPLETILDNPTYFKVNTKDCNIYLNDSYCPVGIKYFKIEQSNGKKAKVYNKDGLLIFDGSDKDDGIYNISCRTTPLTLDIFKNINAPDSWKSTYADRIKNIYTGSNEEWQVVKEVDDTELKEQINYINNKIGDIESVIDSINGEV